jgi:23S rRNA (pseudouridine1915-N3)-methyltransferase
VSFSIDVITFCRKGEPLDQEIARYCELCRPYASVTLNYLKTPGGSSYSISERLTAEARLAAERIRPASVRVAFSEEGKGFTGSIAFARWLSGKMTGGRPITFILGGAYGISPDFKQSCSEVISLSTLTYSHKLALAVLLEQVYRAFTILNRHPYHK